MAAGSILLVNTWLEPSPCQGRTIFMRIRNIEPADAAVWARLRQELWPEADNTHADEIAAFFAGTLDEPQAVLVVEEPAGLVGFAELSIRYDIAELRGQPVGYVEGLYLNVDHRGAGITRKLLRASQNWAREQGCDGFASDRSERIIIDRRF
jgi:aminoglycoside 6'-N-acetyltransferase I